MGHLMMREKIRARKRKRKQIKPIAYQEEEQEDGEPDLHQCGHCKLMFNNLKKYISHKLQKECWNDETNNIPEEGSWLSDQNGLQSPEISSKDDFITEEIQLPQIAPLNHESLKRKHRKGAVRRIKPTEEAKIIVEEIVPPQEIIIPEPKTKVFVVTDELDPEASTELNKSENISTKETIPDNIKTQKTIRNNIDTESNVVGRCTQPIFSNTKKIKDLALSDNLSQNKTEKSVPSEHLLLSFPNNTQPYTQPVALLRGENNEPVAYSSDYYLKTKYDRIPSRLPQVMSTHGSPSSLHENQDRNSREGTLKNSYISGASDYRKYPQPRDTAYSSFHQKFATDYSRSKYHARQEPETSSTWASQYHQTKQPVRSKSKYEVYKPYDKYKNMASMVSSDQDSSNNIVKSKAGSMKESSDNQDPDSTTSSTDLLNEPPHLVRIAKTVGNSPTVDEFKVNSPPALDKCPESLSAFVKQEEINEESNDSILPPPNGTKNAAENEEPIDETSPGKEVNSPDSNQSVETEDYNQEQPLAQPPIQVSVAQLPRVRQLSESTVERLITEPCTQSSDASWKHAKQVYRCPLCAKVFPFKSKLQRHVLVHTGIKPYKCTVCGRGFTQQIDLQRHLTRHTGEKPFKCHLCKAQFIRADNLRKHCKDAHYVNIEEPIRKRRRKATGSDTVLPPLEVAIALAISETERNGGRILGRSTTKTSTKSTTGKPRSTQFNALKSDETTLPVYSARGQRQELPPYGGNFPPHSTGPPRHEIQYPFPAVRDSALRDSAHPYSPDTIQTPSSSPPYRRRELYRHPHERSFYSPQGPPGYYSDYKSRDNPNVYYADQQRSGRQSDSRPMHDHRSMVPIESRAGPYSSNNPEYRQKQEYGRREETEEYMNRYSSDTRHDNSRFETTGHFLSKELDDDRDHRKRVFAERRHRRIHSEGTDKRYEAPDRSYSEYRQDPYAYSMVPPNFKSSTTSRYNLEHSAPEKPKSDRESESPNQLDSLERISPRRDTERTTSRDIYAADEVLTSSSSSQYANRDTPPSQAFTNYGKERKDYFETPVSTIHEGAGSSYIVDEEQVYVDEQEIPIVTPSDAPVISDCPIK